MREFRQTFVWAVMVLAVGSASAQTVTTISVVNRDAVAAPLKPSDSYIIELEAKMDDDVAASSKNIEINVRDGNDAKVRRVDQTDADFDTKTTIATDSAGRAKFVLRPAAKPETLVLDLEPDDADPDTIFMLDWRPIDTLAITSGVPALEPQRVYRNALRVETKQKGGQRPAMFQKVRVRVIGDPDALLFTDPTKPSRSLDVITDQSGTAMVSLQTGEMLEPEFLAVPLDTAGNPVNEDEESIQLTATRRFEGDFQSRRLFTEVFTGATFTNDYDAAGKSTGLASTSPLVRVTFDTIWFNQFRAKDEKSQPPAPTVFRGSQLHTGIDMELADFPFGEDAPNGGDPVEGEEPEPQTTKGLASAFSGAFFAVWQPNHWLWASYTPTSTRLNYPIDALRLGVFTRVGITTRPTVAEDKDTTFRRVQIGLRFTHHQTPKSRPYTDQDNIVPIRFVELSYGHFEQFANEKNTRRVVVDAGFRLPGIGSDAIPFYAGLHFNAGKGADDLRIFAGFLFKINEIAAAFQRAGI